MQYRKLLSEFEPEIRKAGGFVRGEWKVFSRERVETKGKNDLVSYVDRESESLLVKSCRALIPDSSFLLEESGAIHTSSDWRWIIDPLDGTTNFIHGLPAFAISVGLEHKGVRVAAWVLDVAHDELYTAATGSGAFCEGAPIRVSPEKAFSESLIATGFPYSRNNLPDEYIMVLGAFVRQSHGVRRYGAAALDLAWVAAGRFEGFYEIGLQPWDVAAGSLIVEEAGGRVTEFSGADGFLHGKQIVASNSAIHDSMLSLLHDFRHLGKP